MSLWAIIPVKPFSSGKSRLAKVLTNNERTSLNRKLFLNTIYAIKAVETISAILVVSWDPEILMLAENYGCLTYMETSKSGLNAALDQATIYAVGQNTRKALILPSDLPHINTSTIIELINLLGTPPEIIISPDKNGTGTNGIYIDPIGAFKFQFGSSSFEKHLAEAKNHHMRVKIFRSSEMECDLDSPEDLETINLRSSQFETTFLRGGRNG